MLLGSLGCYCCFVSGSRESVKARGADAVLRSSSKAPKNFTWQRADLRIDLGAEGVEAHVMCRLRPHFGT